MTANNYSNIVVFGATGGTGRVLVSQALERGMTVTAFVRDPGKMPTRHERLKVVSGNILDATSVDAALTESTDAAISALGVFIRKPSTELSVGTTNIINALERRGIQRFLVLTSLGVHDSRGQGNLPARLWQRFVIPRMLEDKERQETAVRNSGLAWTLFRPSRLMDDPDIRDDLLEWTGPQPATGISWQITRASLAKRMLDALDDPACIGRALNLSDPA